MRTVKVTSPAEFDTAVTEHGTDAGVEILVDSDPGVTLLIECDPVAGQIVVDSASVGRVGGSASVGRVVGSASVGSVVGSARVGSVVGSASVGRVGDSARVGSVGDSASVGSVVGSARVGSVVGSARVGSVVDSARVDWVGDSASVGRVGDSASVGSVVGSASVGRVGDSASVEQAAGTASVHLYRGGTLARAGSRVAVHLHHKKVTVGSGGVLIDVTDLDTQDPATWCAYNAVEVDAQGMAHLYKAVDDQLVAGHDYTPTMYPIGQTITDPRWRDDHACGGGLHTCPTPAQARDHYRAATRFLEITVPVADLRPIDNTKAKSQSVMVWREVDIHGEPVEVAS